MSFLNPVNEPVKRFSSTDAGAPQINYAARTAGDVKAVLKACLVAGYGATASAGWAIANETASYAEFASPSANMSDILFQINDGSSSATWSYKDLGITVKSFAEIKNTSGVDNSKPDNGWQLLVTDKGFVYIEILHSIDVGDKVARLFYFGGLQSAITNDSASSTGLWATGYNLSKLPISVFKTVSANDNFKIGGIVSTSLRSVSFSDGGTNYNVSNADVFSDIFVMKDESVIAQHPAMLAIRPARSSGLFGVKDIVINGRPAIYIPLTTYYGGLSRQIQEARFIAIFLDYWEF